MAVNGRTCPECGHAMGDDLPRCPMCLFPLAGAPPDPPESFTPDDSSRYETVLYGQHVTVTVLPPGEALGASRNYRNNVRCKTYKHGEAKSQRKRRNRRSPFVRVGRAHPLIQEEQ